MTSFPTDGKIAKIILLVGTISAKFFRLYPQANNSKINLLICVL